MLCLYLFGFLSAMREVCGAVVLAARDRFRDAERRFFKKNTWMQATNFRNEKKTSGGQFHDKLPDS
jgi:hypothetical protein